MEPITEVQSGKLMGKLNKTSNNFEFYTFKGIPYAKPPVKNLRFAPPEPPLPWEGVKDATLDCNICAQFDKATSTVIGAEDCLYLNVYTPSLPSSSSSQLPVMVFFHGGGFLFGNGTDDSAHGPDYLIEKNVVIVSLNYRVGILGFLCLDCKEAPGNMGLKDQVMALKWVQQNIKSFNGDPDNVTIFGFSAGAASVEYLMLSPMAKGLFHKAIANSGSSLLPWAKCERTRELARKIPALQQISVLTDEELLKYLKDMPIQELIAMSMAVIAASIWKGGIHFGFVPTIEKPKDWEPFLSKPTYKLLSDGEFTKVPFMSGFCTREGLLMLPLAAPLFGKVVNEKSFAPYLPFEVDRKDEIDAELKGVYLKEDKEYGDDDSYAVDFYTDVDFLAGIHIALSMIAKSNSPVFFYEFAYDGNLNYIKKKMQINRKGACHGDDGGYLIKSEILKGKLSENDIMVRERMCLMWTNFAKYGNPTPELNNVISTKWEPVEENKIKYLLINDKLTMKINPYEDRMKIFTDLYREYYKL
ncbi:esterase FE4-like [Aricia agestis]|uniref:esterase FE4-like n=1 Tax=Aricia agestis TaxID=91739 RepID=UPI001C204572|nr:esterase FE4-like [Aricia agestis]XP_041986523.1 esterase FE4-like [Aricia agestis]